MKREYLLISTAATLWGLIIVGGQYFTNKGLSAYSISTYSILFSTLTLSIIVLLKRELIPKKETLGFFIIFGIIGMAASVLQYVGLSLGISIAVVTFLLYLQPVWTIIFGRILLKEEITKQKMLAGIIALAGIIFLISPWNSKGAMNPTGIITSIIAGMFISLWMIFGRMSALKKQHYLTTNFGSLFFAAIFSIVLAPIIPRITGSPAFKLSLNIPGEYILGLFLFAVITQLIPHSIFYKALERVEASKAGIIALLEPVSATIFAAIIFAQPITIPVMIGGGLILLSNYIVET